MKCFLSFLVAVTVIYAPAVVKAQDLSQEVIQDITSYAYYDGCVEKGGASDSLFCWCKARIVRQYPADKFEGLLGDDYDIKYALEMQMFKECESFK